MKTVKHTLDTLPPLTEAQKDNLKRLAAMPDNEIDTSDMPELTDAQLAEMKRPGHYRPVKKQITAYQFPTVNSDSSGSSSIPYVLKSR